MAGKLSSALTAACAAVYVGSNTFGIVAGLVWAMTRDLGYGDVAVIIGVLAGLPFGIISAVWIGRLAYQTERTMDGIPSIP